MSTENVTLVVASTIEMLKRGLASTSDIRQGQEWLTDPDKVIEHNLKRLVAVCSGVLEQLSDPRASLFFFAGDAEELRRNAAAFVQACVDYVASPPSLVNSAWPPLSAVAAIVRNAWAGSVFPNSEGALQGVGVQLEQALQRVQRLNAETSALRNLQAEVSAQTTELKTQVQGQLVENTSSFLRRQTEQEEAFQQTLKTARGGLEAAEGRHREAVEELKRREDESLREFAEKNTAALAALNSLHENTVANIKAQELKVSAAVGAVGETGQAAGFEQTAKDAAIRAKWWQVGAVATMVLVVSIAVVALTCGAPFEANAAGIASVITKVVLVFALGIISRYCAAMADRERRENLWAKQRGLEFRALNAYLENLGEPSRVAMREKLLDKYFGVGSTMLTEVSSQGPVATGSHDAAVEGLKFLLEKIPKDSWGPLFAAVLPQGEKKPEKPEKTKE